MDIVSLKINNPEPSFHIVLLERGSAKKISDLPALVDLAAVRLVSSSL